MRRPSHTVCLSLHGVLSLKQWLVKPALATTVAELGETKEKVLQIK